MVFRPGTLALVGALFFALLVLVPPGHATVAPGDSLEGSWSGHWASGDARLPVTVRFTRTAGGYAGSFDSDQLRVQGIPFREIVFTPPRVTWKIPGDFTTSEFEGELRDGFLRGRYRDGNKTGTFSFERMARAPEEPRQEDVRFTNGATSLAGTILLPRSPGPHAGIVFLHGSGAEGRWANRYLATRFAERGVAALIFDKRGVGESKGDWRTATFEDLAEDAAAAVAALRSHREVDRRRVGIHGHSQGGTIAPLVAVRVGDPAFLVGSAASGLPMDEVEIFSLRNSIRGDSLAPAEAALADRYVRAVVATAYHGAPRESLLAVYDLVREKPWAFEPPPANSHYWSFSRLIAAYDPLPYWEKVTAPTLLVYGDRDKRVPPRESVRRIEQRLSASARSGLTVRFFEGADHTFRIPARVPGGWPESAPGYPAAVLDWVLATVK